MRGYVALYGVNLCKVLSYIFPKHINCVKDHDFVEVVGSHHTVYVDASMKDVIFTDLNMIKKANELSSLFLSQRHPPTHYPYLVDDTATPRSSHSFYRNK